MRGVIFAALTWACAGFAVAEEPPPAPDAIALEIIVDAGAEDVFGVVPSEQPRVRHFGSGLVCGFDVTDGNRILVFSESKRGDDVGCDTYSRGAALTLYATRYAYPTTIDDQIAGAREAILSRFPDAEAVNTEGAFDAPRAGDLPESRHARFAITLPEGRRMLTRASIAMTDGWVIKMRFTAPIQNEDAMAARDVMASMIWMRALADLHSADPPIATAAR